MKIYKIFYSKRLSNLQMLERKIKQIKTSDGLRQKYPMKLVHDPLQGHKLVVYTTTNQMYGDDVYEEL